ncbi:hypothetical protein [Shewanella maritima]|uniref:hypothetical protein n=1 Tax=Shewanella maritima TaxID=2520507 RepID=UPI0037363871
MILKLYDDLLQGLWAYSVSKGVSEENAYYLTRIQIVMFEMFIFIPIIFLAFTFVDVSDNHMIIGVTVFGLVLETINQWYINKKQLFQGVDCDDEVTKKKITKCNVFYIFLFIYVPFATYLLSVLWS